MNAQTPLTGAERTKRWRAAMRAKGLRPRTLWLPDVSSEAFKAQLRRDSERLTEWQERHPEILDELEAAQHWPAAQPG